MPKECSNHGMRSLTTDRERRRGSLYGTVLVALGLALLAAPVSAFGSACRERDFGCADGTPEHPYSPSAPAAGRSGVGALGWFLIGATGSAVLFEAPGLAIVYLCGPGTSCAGDPWTVGLVLALAGGAAAFLAIIAVGVAIHNQSVANSSMFTPQRPPDWSIAAVPVVGGGAVVATFRF